MAFAKLNESKSELNYKIINSKIVKEEKFCWYAIKCGRKKRLCDQLFLKLKVESLFQISKDITKEVDAG